MFIQIRVQFPTMHRRIPFTLLFSLLLLFTAFAGLISAQSGLHVVSWQVDGLPLTAFYNEQGDPAARPLVLVAHGFAGSERAMRAFSLGLAHAGYTVIAWGFAGHGANTEPDGDLLADAEKALAQAGQRGLGDPGRVAILGHSMGSGVALRFGSSTDGRRYGHLARGAGGDARTAAQPAADGRRPRTGLPGQRPGAPG
jgi:dienelactone hydrolase